MAPFEVIQSPRSSFQVASASAVSSCFCCSASSLPSTRSVASVPAGVLSVCPAPVRPAADAISEAGGVGVSPVSSTVGPAAPASGAGSAEAESDVWASAEAAPATWPLSVCTKVLSVLKASANAPAGNEPVTIARVTVATVRRRQSARTVVHLMVDPFLQTKSHPA